MRHLPRRHFLTTGLCGSASLITLPNSLASSSTNNAVQSYRLWPGSPPDEGGPIGTIHTSKTGALSHIHDPILNVFRPSHPNGAIVLIAAGGGYQRIGWEHEAMPAARWLLSLGITAAILMYRLPGEGWNHRPAAPFEDAQRAVQLIRSGHISSGIDPHRIGTLGFSAGGHLLGMHSLRPNHHWGPRTNTQACPSASVALTMLLYPVVTLERPLDHSRARINLIGTYPTDEQRRTWSLPPYCHPTAPPLFLAQADDDPIVSVEQSALLENHYRAQRCSVERHIFPTGGHGFALGRPHTQTRSWPDLAEQWMRQIGFI